MSDYKVGDKVIVFHSGLYRGLDLPCIGEIVYIYKSTKKFRILLTNYHTDLTWNETSFRKLTPLDEVI